MAVATLVMQAVLSWRIGVHWVVLGLWGILIMLFAGFLCVWLVFAMLGRLTRVEFKVYDNWWGRRSGVRSVYYYSWFLVKVLGSTVFPMLTGFLVWWTVLDVVAIATRLDVGGRASHGR